MMDLLSAACAVRLDGHQAVSVWLTTRPLIEQIIVNSEKAQATRRGPPTTDDDVALVAAAGAVCETVLNRMDQTQREIIGSDLTAGCHMRVYVNPDIGDVVLVIVDARQQKFVIAYRLAEVTLH